jgi:hypothetical protein
MTNCCVCDVLCQASRSCQLVQEISKLIEINIAYKLVQIRVDYYELFYRTHLHVKKSTFLLDRGVLLRSKSEGLQGYTMGLLLSSRLTTPVLR